MPPAISTNSDTHPIAEISGSSPLLEKHPRPPGQALRASSDFGQVHLELAHELPGPLIRVDHCADRADHVEDPGNASLVEGVDVEPAADQIGGDVGLEVGEGQDEVRLQRQDFVDVRRGEGTDTRLFAASLRRVQDITGDPDDAVLLAEQIKGVRRSLR
jgi:hypothetical protein